jgi:hypothetical protein
MWVELADTKGQFSVDASPEKTTILRLCYPCFMGKALCSEVTHAEDQGLFTRSLKHHLLSPQYVSNTVGARNTVVNKAGKIPALVVMMGAVMTLQNTMCAMTAARGSGGCY